MDFVVALVLRLATLVMQAIGIIDAFLRGVMSRAGIGSQAQDIVLVAVAVVCIVAALRVFGGLLRFLIIVFLILLLMHVLLPGMRIPDYAHV